MSLNSQFLNFVSEKEEKEYSQYNYPPRYKHGSKTSHQNPPCFFAGGVFTQVILFFSHTHLLQNVGMFCKWKLCGHKIA